MSSPIARGQKIQVNIKAPQNLHLVRHHSAKHHQMSVKDLGIPEIKQQNRVEQQNRTQNQIINHSPHKIRHLDSVQDRGEFMDQKHQNRVSESQQIRETISRTIHPEPQLPVEDAELEKIDEEANQEPQFKPLKHLTSDEMHDKDQFNLRLSQLSNNITRKRRLSESNLDGYEQTQKRFSVVDYLNQLKKTVPEKIIEEQTEFQKKGRLLVSPQKRQRKNSVHSIYRYRNNKGIPEEIERMIVDEIDKKKKARQEYKDKMQQEEDSQMESIKEQKQEEDLVNTSKLEQSRQKVEQQLSDLSKVIGKQIGPQNAKHLKIRKEAPIQQEPNSDNQEQK